MSAFLASLRGIYYTFAVIVTRFLDGRRAPYIFVDYDYVPVFLNYLQIIVIGILYRPHLLISINMEIIQTIIRVFNRGTNHPLLGYLRLSSAYAVGAVVSGDDSSYGTVCEKRSFKDTAKGIPIT
jgi:hypothetical protein